MRLPLFAAVSLVLILPACGGCGTANPPAASTCTLNGQAVNVGDQVQDDCNICVCNSDVQLDCTHNDCDGHPDAGVHRDAGPTVVDAGEVDAGQSDGPCKDEDGDGFYTCLDPNHPERPQVIDCDDHHFSVQPGGIEFPDTPEDDNCDGHNDDFTTCGCDGQSSRALDLASALDLCGTDQISTASESGAAIQFGLVAAYRDVIQPRIRARIDIPGTPPVIIGNQCLVTISSGDATGTQEGVAASHCGFTDPLGANDFEICDQAQIHLHLVAPTNARGFAFDFMFISQEWPEFLCQTFNDTFYAIVEGDSAVNAGVATNTAFDSSNRPITVNVGFFENPSQWTQTLAGTPYGTSENIGCPDPCDPNSGFDCQAGCQLPSYCSDGTIEGSSGSGSGWLTTQVPVTPGQAFDLTFVIQDESDQDFDSLALIDAFRWLPDTPPLRTEKGP